MLPPAPEGWVQAAQELPTARAALDQLVARAEADAELRRRILNDLEAALAAEGVERNSALLAELRDAALAVALRPGSSDDRGVHRKVVTVLFCDVVGSTALGESVDPEALQVLLARYFERMKAIVESHEGTVEKFIGDAVMAVFGVPAVHEDDALRACRAAVEMRAAFPSSASQGRIGVNTGEVVTGTEERLATGDAVNVAARLQQAAAPGRDPDRRDDARARRRRGRDRAGRAARAQGEERAGSRAPTRRRARGTRALARDRVRRPRARGRARSATPGNARSAEQRCELVTIVGEAGLGKSRLVAEALAAIDARVVRGRCLPYGEGITYWPVVEVVKQLDALPSDPAAAAAIRSLLGETEQGTSAEEIAWAFRKLLEEQAPLVVVFDDIQWGEQTFLDLVEGVALLAGGADPARLHGPPRAARAARGLARRPPPRAAARGGGRRADRRAAVRAAGANRPRRRRQPAVPHGDAGDGRRDRRGRRPADAARAPRRPARPARPPERAVLERGAVEGELFHRGAVQALAPEETQITPRLAVLTRRT